MTSWKLWHALRYPPFWHPLFRRGVIARNTPLWRPAPGKGRSAYLTALILSLALIIALARPSAFEILLVTLFGVPAALLILFMAAPLLFPLAVSLQAAVWAAHISYALAAERERGTYDLLCLFPDGSLGANWAIACGCVHRGVVFDALHVLAQVVLLLGMVFLAIIWLIVLGIVANPVGKAGQDILAASRTLIDTVVLIAALGLHYTQTVVLSPVVGMWWATHAHRRIEAQLGAFGLSLAVQIGTYGLFLVVGFALLPLLYDGLPLASPAINLSLPVVYLVILYIIREGAIFWLWKIVTRRLNADPGGQDPPMPTSG